jgi:hypothetical protein
MAVEVVHKWISDNYQAEINNRMSAYSVSLNDLYLRLFIAELLALAANLQFCLSRSFSVPHMSGRGYVSWALDWKLIFLYAINSGQYGQFVLRSILFL